MGEQRIGPKLRRRAYAWLFVDGTAWFDMSDKRLKKRSHSHRSSIRDFSEVLKA